jgi:transcriptional regulator with XRE-family HTH domain
LLRSVRRALNIPVKEIATKMGVARCSVFELELREQNGVISMRSLERVAEAMGWKVVYGVVPAGGKTLQRVAEERLWRSVLGVGTANGEGKADGENG